MLGKHAVIIAVSTQKNIARQQFQNRERFGKVVGDLRIIDVLDETIAGVNVRAADDDDLVAFAVVGGSPCPRGAAASVSGRAASNQSYAAELNGVSVIQDAIDGTRFPAT